LLALSLAWADHGAPPPQLGGTVLCVELSSVQVGLEAEAAPPAVTERVRMEVFSAMQARLETEGVPYRTDCAAVSGYVLLGLEAHFLDPETYLGFPKDSYTYVTTAQVGSFVGAAQPDTALPGRRYTGSASDIFQALTPGDLVTRLTGLGLDEFNLLVQAWSEANALTPGGVLRFAALGLALALLRAVPLSLAATRGRSSSPHPPT